MGRIAYRSIFLNELSHPAVFTIDRSLISQAAAMDPYDSDSSIDEDFTETGVLLGYANDEVIEDTISHLGGWPVWFC